MHAEVLLVLLVLLSSAVHGFVPAVVLPQSQRGCSGLSAPPASARPALRRSRGAGRAPTGLWVLEMAAGGDDDEAPIAGPNPEDWRAFRAGRMPVA